MEANNDCKYLPLVVVRAEGPSLLGRNWLIKIKLDWVSVLSVKMPEMLEPFKEIFEEELGTIKAPKVHLDLKPGTKPIFHRPRPVPYALREKVNEELLRMERQGNI